MRLRSIFVLLLTANLLISCRLNADDFEWTGGAGSSNWNDSANWANTTIGGTDSDGVPDTDDQAEFPIDAVAQGGSALGVVVPSNVTVTIGSSSLSTVGVAGTISNSGTITFDADIVDSNIFRVDQRLLVESDVVLNGGGTIQLNGIETGIDSNNASNLTNIDNTIRGSGTIQGITLNNQGSIIAENGVLRIGNAIVNNSGQIDIASNGALETTNTTISGGTISGAIGARFQGGTFADLTTTGTLTLSGSPLTQVELSGTITNLGEIGFEEDNTNTNIFRVDQRLLIDSDVTLDGGGTIRFNGSETGIDSNFTTATLTNVDNTIRGSGRIQDIILSNQGSLIAENGVLRIQNTTVDNTGAISIASNGELETTGSIITGGTLNGVGEARLRGGTLADLDTTGTLTVGGSASGLAEVELSGTINNSGEITFEADSTTTDIFRVDHRLLINSAVTLDGGGTIRLNGSETGIDSNTNSAVLTNVDNTIRGNGTIQDVTLNNQGTLIVEGGTLRIDGSVGSDNAGGTIEVRADSILDASGSDFDGGSILGTNGQIAGGTFSNISSTGQWSVGGGAGLAEAELAGTITNSGEITFEEDNTNTNIFRIDQRLLIDSTVTLNGGGTIRLNGSETGIEAGTSPAVLTNVNNTIRGNGIIQDVSLNNQGSLIAEGGTLRIANSVGSDNAGGTIEVRADGILNASGSDFNGGSILGTNGRIAGGTFSNISSTGQWSVGGGAGLAETELAGTITNSGEITFEEDNTNTDIFRTDQRLLIDSTVTLDGGGTIRLNGTETGFDAVDGTSVLQNIDNTIRGDGVVNVDLVNEGRLFADATDGILEFNNQLTLSETGTLSVLLGGDQFDDSGLFDVGEFLIADGIFQPVVDSDTLIADIGDTYIFLTGNIDIDSRFSSIDNSLAGPFRFDVIYNSDSIAVEVVGVPEPSSLVILTGLVTTISLRRRKGKWTA